MIGICFPDELFDEEARQNTPGRIDRMGNEFAEWRNWELDKGIFECNGYNDLIIEKDIPFTSFCGHHLLPFWGNAYIAYLPNGHIVGLSKLARTVRKFASRPQVQEQMTHDIANYLMDKIPNIQGVMTMCKARHMCQEVRGARIGGITVTSAIRGKFIDNPTLKMEAVELMK